MTKALIYMPLSVASILSACSSAGTEVHQQQPHQVTFYVNNVSQSQPATDLLILWDTTLVAQDTFRYTNISDQYKTYQLTARRGEHLIRVLNRLNQLRLDTIIRVHSPFTHIFIGFNYKELSEVELERIKLMDPPEGVDAVVAAISEPKRLYVHIMEGPITIP